MEREKQITQLLQDVRGVLSYQKTCSVVEYPGAAALDSFLNNCDWQTSAPPSTAKMSQVEKNPVKTPVTSTPAPVTKSDQSKLSEIATEVAVCSGCTLSEQRPCVIPGTGRGDNIRLLIVGHWLSTTAKSTAVFGAEEDQMLQRMLVCCFSGCAASGGTYRCLLLVPGTPNCSHCSRVYLCNGNGRHKKLAATSSVPFPATGTFSYLPGRRWL